MRFWNRIKYHLLHWLLDDICEKSGEFDERICARSCEGCELNYPSENNGILSPCGMGDVLKQALRAWRLYTR